MPDAKKKCVTHLLSDAPTRNDSFSHASVAAAIAELVLTEKGAKCIGLTGTWGSGKSSVVEILRDKLKDLGKGNVQIFVFDAWAHQGDPLRRSFLEQLITMLAASKWLRDPVYWKEKKDELAKRKQVVTTTSQPQLTFLGGLFALTLLLLPLGYQLFVKFISEPVPQFFLALTGLFVVTVPFILVSCAWLAWRPTFKVWTARFWKTHRRPHHEKSLLALFLNKSKEVIESNTIRTPDPTSVEFQAIFGELAKEVLRESNRRLVVVIDNLDRIEPKEALAIWATLKTFFDFDAHGNDSCLERLWLLLPFDELAIRKLWADSSTSQSANNSADSSKGAELGQAFIDKTFQVGFRVSPPVLSEWHEFLKRQLKEALPAHGDEDFHNVYRIFDLRAVVASRPPTPRDIKIFVNRVGAIHRQWEDSIALPVQALYAVLSRNGTNLAEDLALKNDAEMLKSLAIDIVGKDWRESLAAIHFNVPKDSALQVVIGGQLKECLASGNSEKLKQLASIPGFTTVLEKQIEDSFQNWAKGETSGLAIAASTLTAVPEASDSSWNRTWNWFFRGAMEVQSWSRFDSQVAGGIAHIVERSSSSGPLLTQVTKAVSNSFPRNALTTTQTELETWLEGVYFLIDKFEKEHSATFKTELNIPAAPELYVRAIHVAANRQNWTDKLQYLRPAGERARIVEEISKLIGEGKYEDSQEKTVMAMERVEGHWPWDTVIDSAFARLRTASNLTVLEVSSLISALLRFEVTNPKAKELLQNLCDDGFISQHLHLASSNALLSAQCSLALLEHLPAGVPKSNASPNTPLGVAIYNEIISAADQRNETIAALADLIISLNKFDVLFDSPRTTAQTAPLSQAALRKIAQAQGAYEHISPTRLLQNKEFVKTALGNEAFSNLVIQSVKMASLPARLSETNFDLGFLDVYRTILTVDTRNTKFTDFLVGGLRSLETHLWLDALSSESELLDLLLDVRKGSLQTDLTIEFEDALLEHAHKLVDGTAQVERFSNSWTSIFESLEKDLQAATLKKMVEILCTSAEPTDSLLKLYGRALSSPTVLASEKERVALHAFPSFIGRLRVVELDWLCSILEQNPNFLTQVSTSVRQDIGKRIVQASRESAIGEEVSSAIRRLAKLAAIDITASEPSSEDSVDSTRREET